MKLWQRGSSLHPLIESYTVGDDYLLDQYLIPYDISASEAHLRMLALGGIVTQDELKKGLKGLKTISSLHAGGDFSITKGQEDMHTAIESFLTKEYGAVGRKIHTGRSRNDQILVAIRLYMKDQKKNIEGLISDLLQTLKDKIDATDPGLEMPGYTHYQKAMRTTVVKWYTSYYDAFSDQMTYIAKLDTLINQSPLGSASGFGIANFMNDRDFTAKELGFGKVQKNEMYCGLSRGLFELCFLQSLEPFFLLMARCCNDLLLFSTQEFSFVSLPPNLTTGSSIMPQKRNWDVCEIMRANQSVFSSYIDQIRAIYSRLISGYQRDLQMTKGPLIQGINIFSDTLHVMRLIFTNLEWNQSILAGSIDESLLLTEKVYQLVSQGIEFRDAYGVVKEAYFNTRDPTS